MSASPLVLAADLPGRTIVAIDSGDDIAEIRDVVFDPTTGSLIGFTLNKRGWFRGRLKRTLPVDAIAAIGPDAVLTPSAKSLVATGHTDEELPADDGFDVIGVRVLTESGDDLGEISDVVLETGSAIGAVGYRVTGENGDVFVPIASQISLSDQNIMLPAATSEFIRTDLAGFGAAVQSHRALLGDNQTQESLSS